MVDRERLRIDPHALQCFRVGNGSAIRKQHEEIESIARVSKIWGPTRLHPQQVEYERRFAGTGTACHEMHSAAREPAAIRAQRKWIQDALSERRRNSRTFK